MHLVLQDYIGKENDSIPFIQALSMSVNMPATRAIASDMVKKIKALLQLASEQNKGNFQRADLLSLAMTILAAVVPSIEPVKKKKGDSTWCVSWSEQRRNEQVGWQSNSISEGNID